LEIYILLIIESTTGTPQLKIRCLDICGWCMVLLLNAAGFVAFPGTCPWPSVSQMQAFSSDISAVWVVTVVLHFECLI